MRNERSANDTKVNVKQRSHVMSQRRQFILQATALLACGPALAFAESAAAPVVQVYKSPTCGCCGKWVEHMRKAGFIVETHDVEDVVAYKHQ
jgi:hypothetical protein